MINQRIFSANVGDSSVGIAGPDAIEQDIDNLLANDQELLGQINDLDANIDNLLANDQELLGQINDLDANKVDNSRVLTDVPVNAKFTDTVYTHPTTAGNKHIPAGGATNQYLKYSASGTAVWSALGDASSVNGKSIWVGAEGSKGTDANTIYFCY